MTLPSPNSVRFGGMRADYLHADRPGARTVLLLHGGGLDRASLSWRYLFPRLAETYSVFAPDWPGYGGSTPLDRPYTIADLGHWLISFMDELGIGQADMVGVSMGGGASLWLALHHPQRVRRLVPVGTYGLQGRAPFHRLSHLATRLSLSALSFAAMRRSRWATRRALASIFADPKRIAPELVDEVAQVLAEGSGPRAFSDFQRGEIGRRRLRTVLMPQIDGVAHPTLFLHGRADSLVPLTDIRLAAKRMPNAEIKVLDAGHWPMREVPNAFNDEAERFLA